MPLTNDRVIEQTRILLGYQRTEREKLDKVRRYWKGRQDLPATVPASAPQEVKTMAKIARVNVCDVIVESLSQSMFVDGLRVRKQSDNVASWAVWQANRFDRRQSGVHRAAFAYGTSYALVVPGDPVPVIRGASPRRLTALYGEDPDWPIWALESWGGGTYRLYDEEAVYFIGKKGFAEFAHLGTELHDMGVCPVVRFVDAEDLDADDDIDEARDDLILGQIAPMMNLQDQIDLTSFNLLVAQHYTAFRQRWAIGWVPTDEVQKVKAAASQLWTFDKAPDEMSLGEFGETNLEGYIKSRAEVVKFAATLSQTPVHELVGELINLSAEALAAAEAGRDRKVQERKSGFGESWEQVFQLVGKVTGDEIPNDVEVRWRDTSARAFGAIVDGLGKLAQMLGVPPRGLWELIPGVTDQQIASWEAMAAEGDALGRLEQRLAEQAAEGDE